MIMMRFFRKEICLHMKNDIDFVILWVDGNDSDWQKKKAGYLPKANDDISASRYRDWGMLRYWFRSVEKNASWVRRIHFVTDDQIPEWMNTEHPKLHIVSHRDYIPEENLPLFNSSAIEIGMGNIPQLADHFVFFNDDTLLNAPITPEYYFDGGVPVDMAGLTRIGPVRTTFGHLLQNDHALINRHFCKREVICNNFLKWYNPKYGKTFLRTLLHSSGKDFSGFVIPHLSVPYRKSDIERVWEAEREMLSETQTHRFRSNLDLNHFVYRYWRLCVGDFAPRKSKGTYISLRDMDSVRSVEKSLKNRKCPELCLNDNWENGDFENAKNQLLTLLEKKYPQKSSFEK